MQQYFVNSRWWSKTTSLKNRQLLVKTLNPSVKLFNINESCVKHLDYLTHNSSLHADYRSVDDKIEPKYKRKLFEIPIANYFWTCKTKWEREALEFLDECLERKDFFSTNKRRFLFCRASFLLPRILNKA